MEIAASEGTLCTRQRDRTAARSALPALRDAGPARLEQSDEYIGRGKGAGQSLGRCYGVDDHQRLCLLRYHLHVEYWQEPGDNGGRPACFPVLAGFRTAALGRRVCGIQSAGEEVGGGGFTGDPGGGTAGWSARHR